MPQEKHILIVDDEPSIQDFVRRNLLECRHCGIFFLSVLEGVIRYPIHQRLRRSFRFRAILRRLKVRPGRTDNHPDGAHQPRTARVHGTALTTRMLRARVVSRATRWSASTANPRSMT